VILLVAVFLGLLSPVPTLKRALPAVPGLLAPNWIGGVETEPLPKTAPARLLEELEVGIVKPVNEVVPNPPNDGVVTRWDEK